MHPLIWLLAGFSCLCLGGCANKARLAVSTQPLGGYVSEQSGGSVAGTAPLVIAYDPEMLLGHKDSSGCFLVKGLEARWVSGAVTRTESPIRLCGSPSGSYTYRLNRDPSHPGLDRDLQFAAQLSGLAAQQAQANAAAYGAAAALLKAGQQPASQPAGGAAVAFLKREYTSGFNKICIYDRMGSEYALTIPSTSLCALTTR